eukprot:12903810-Prorocentrum_lima.AAC.1
MGKEEGWGQDIIHWSIGRNSGMLIVKALTRLGQAIELDGSVTGPRMGQYKGTFAHVVGSIRAQLAVVRDGTLDLDDDK